jgi:hypothetical protein
MTHRYSQASQSASQSTSKRARTLSRKQLSDVLRETDVNTPANRGGADFALDDEEMSETSEEDAMDEWNG